VGIACAGLSGCAGFWDEVTSRDFSVRNLVSPPEPMSVLRSSTDGDARAKAMRRLDVADAGPAEQEEALVLLTRAAAADPQPVCRSAAVQALGRYKDPRVVPALVAAYDSADQLTPELAYMIRAQALTALGETKQPEAAQFLVQVARQPVKSDLADRERGQARDVRLAAVRSLKNFPGFELAAATAGQLARTERDVAVRDRARESYVALTGQELSPTAPAAPTPAPVQNVGHTQSARP
jgi:HEAT repeat protein